VSRITECFQRVKKNKRAALIPYVTAGDPNQQTTRALLPALVQAGADMIELGVPFSDPMADGIVIQQAHQRALASGMNLQRVLEEVAYFRQKNNETPIVLMTYVNPIETMSYEQFAKQAEQAGVDGVLLVDFSLEESDAILPLWKSHGLDSIFLIAPTTSPARAQKICNATTGYVYVVSLKGVTGTNDCQLPAIEVKMAELRRMTDLPICIGFGIDTPEKAVIMAKHADGVIIGSALIKCMAQSPEKAVEVASAFIKKFKV
jgi:tryptophan synthase alpha chain